MVYVDELDALLDWADESLDDSFDEGFEELLSPAETHEMDAFIEIDHRKAVSLNERYADRLNWRRHFDRIVELLAASGCLPPYQSPNARAFAEGIACWQSHQRGLSVDGVIGPNTWARLRSRLNLGTAPSANATQYFKDDRSLQTVPLQPTAPITINPRWPNTRKKIAATYNRLGGLMQKLARQVSIEVPAVLAVWQIESGGHRHTPGRAIIRFENHLFFRNWGKQNSRVYRQHFKHGGYAGTPGRSWENHQFRVNPTASFSSFHGNQNREYQVLALASQLGGEAAALKSISIGGPQILIKNYRILGYASPRQMYDAFQNSERYHVLGFFDFCRHHPSRNLLIPLQRRDWVTFARYYNGAGKAQQYGRSIQSAYQQGKQLPL